MMETFSRKEIYNIDVSRKMIVVVHQRMPHQNKQTMRQDEDHVDSSIPASMDLHTCSY